MSKRISLKRVLELREKEQLAIKSKEKKVEKHIKYKAKIKIFIDRLKQRYRKDGRTDLADKLELEEKIIKPAVDRVKKHG